MAVNWVPKAEGATYRYTWAPALLPGDTISSYVLEPDGASIVSDSHDSSVIEVYLAGGAVGAICTIAATVYTTYGETQKETIYVPIVSRDLARLSTAGEIAAFALRKIVGIGEQASSGEFDDALEWLNDMLADWKGQGADTGVNLPLEASEKLYVPDQFIAAIKNNLIIRVADNYGREISPVTAKLAMTGLQQIKQALLPRERGTTEYF
ncbi:packaged DNA stabilization gp4 family protein [Caenibius sp. WL]|uniref:packaged DNA stabilization gp4 family protein n=1 Tax=Caenibius sp. WL TaxID=2872646 RepID=UPI001C99372B|nr:packaged DNA stabilization gp4 family protein [Caenibius sp. WL]QZP07775.1 packaged DNA stabilization gp4 family protein [Caenibius sp. WL]QZP09992.1 packaged DNA stabilization gp4 family protein [Caenibius sp. WL]